MQSHNVVPPAEDSRMLLETWNFMKLFEQSSTSVVLKDANGDYNCTPSILSCKYSSPRLGGKLPRSTGDMI